jgi:putative ABC transport system permease protein
MIRNYLTIAWRNLVRQKGYSALNILGLAMGIAVAILIFSYVRVDLRWDRWHENTDNIVRLVELQDFGEDERTDVAVTMPPLAPMLIEELPEVIDATRLLGWNSPLISRGDAKFYDRDVAYVDPSYFTMFSFTLKQGNREEVFARKDAIVLTQTAVDRYFSQDEDPVGQILRINNKRDAIVTGVLDEPAGGTHFQSEVFIPFESITDDSPGIDVEEYGTNNLATYLLLTPGTSITELGTKVTEAYHRHGDWAELEFYVQPLSEMHLYSRHIEIDNNPGGTDANIVWVLWTIGVFILLLASINYMNLATARSMTRAREVGLRKVAGAKKRELLFQFLSESILVAFFSMLLAALFVELFSSMFNNLSGRDLDISLLGGGFHTALLLGLGLLVGLASGLYPAAVLSSFRPVQVLKTHDARTTASGGWLRRGLVIFQFSISIMLIIATGIVYTQIRYAMNKPLGYNRDHVLVMFGLPPEFHENPSDHLNEFRQIPGVEEVSKTSRIPTMGGSSSGMTPEGSDRSRVTNYNVIDPGAQKVFGWEMADGRFFSTEFTSDKLTEEDSVGVGLVNEAAVKQFGWEDPVGKHFQFWGVDFTVIGVVRDYHFQSLRRAIEPMIYVNMEDSGSLVSMRFNRGDVSAFVDEVEAVWQSRFPDHPFSTMFLDENFDRMFRSESRQAGLLQAFSIIAIVIACLGIFGLAAFATSRRTREIAVRKVLGASEGRIYGLLTKEFILLVLISNLIAWPLSFWAMSKWFENIAYHAPWPYWIFPAAGGATLLIALLSVSMQALKVVRLRPAKALRYE